MQIRDTARFSHEETRGLTGGEPIRAVVPAHSRRVPKLKDIENVETAEVYRGTRIVFYKRKGKFQEYDAIIARGLVACGFFNPDLESLDTILAGLKAKMF